MEVFGPSDFVIGRLTAAIFMVSRELVLTFGRRLPLFPTSCHILR
jgi:hypothetical protein